MSRATAIVGAIAAAALLVVGYSLYAGAQKRAQQANVIERVRDSTGRLRQALAPKPAPALVEALDANLQAAKSPRDRALEDAAEHYILSAREIARRRVEAGRLERQAEASRAALASHMARAAHRNDAWFRNATELKRRAERDYFDWGVQLKALEELLFTLPEDVKRIEPLVGTELVLDNAEREAARRQALAEAKRAAAELASLRGQR
jgi:hypothetical protein